MNEEEESIAATTEIQHNDDGGVNKTTAKFDIVQV